MKYLLALVAAAAFLGISAPSSAEARDHRHHSYRGHHHHHHHHSRVYRSYPRYYPSYGYSYGYPVRYSPYYRTSGYGYHRPYCPPSRVHYRRGFFPRPGLGISLIFGR